MPVYVSLLRGVNAGKAKRGPWAGLRVWASVLKLHAPALSKARNSPRKRV
jgi:hypothetical protein